MFRHKNARLPRNLTILILVQLLALVWFGAHFGNIFRKSMADNFKMVLCESVADFCLPQLRGQGNGMGEKLMRLFVPSYSCYAAELDEENYLSLVEEENARFEAMLAENEIAAGDLTTLQGDTEIGDSGEKTSEDDGKASTEQERGGKMIDRTSHV